MINQELRKRMAEFAKEYHSSNWIMKYYIDYQTDKFLRKEFTGESWLADDYYKIYQLYKQVLTNGLSKQR